jgi:hypothetical protein
MIKKAAMASTIFKQDLRSIDILASWSFLTDYRTIGSNLRFIASTVIDRMLVWKQSADLKGQISSARGGWIM